jgi:hypothetical protein
MMKPLNRKGYKLGDKIFCPLSEKVYKVIGYAKGGLPITQEIEGDPIGDMEEERDVSTKSDEN